MTDYSRYLILEKPLVVLPTIARALDINKAIILQQVQYWLKDSEHERDGYRWVWNSYREWSEQFTWLTSRAIRHHIRELEKLGLLVSGEYNRDTRDKTKWYRIDYAAVDELVTKASHGVSKSGTPPVAEGTMHVTPEVLPLPETTPKTTTRDTHTYGEFQNVLLTDDEYERLEKKYGASLLDQIEELSIGLASKDYKYKNHCAAIHAWARRDNGQRPNTSQRYTGRHIEEDSNKLKESWDRAIAGE